MEELTSRVSELEKRVKTLEEAGHTAPMLSNNKKMSPKEFLLLYPSTSATQKTLLLVYFIENYKKEVSFNTADVSQLFREAKEKQPANINDLVNNNIKKGFIMDAAEKKDNKKAWGLTVLGENYVDTTLKKR